MNFLQKLAEQEEWNGGQGPVQSSAPTPDVMRQSPPPAKNKTLMHMLYRTQAEEEEVTAQHDEFITFLRDNPSPSEEEMNAFADQQGLNPDDLDERIYALLSSLLKGVGKNNDTPDEEYDPEQLAKGIEVEMEHTEDELVAKMIAKDHLAEIPDYYDRLGKMEDEAGAGEEDMDMDDNSEETDEIMAGEQDMEMPKRPRASAEEEEFSDEDEDMNYSDIGAEDDMDMGDEEDMDMDMGDESEYDDEDMDSEEVDPSEVVRLAKDFESGEISYDEFRSELDALESGECCDDAEMGDEDMGDESDYESGDLGDDEFEVDMGSADEVEGRGAGREERPGRDRHVKRLTFKESLLRG